MMLRLALLVALFALPVQAQETEESPGAVLRWLDKITGETADIELSRGEGAISGHLTILLDECRYPAENPASDAFVHLTITDQRVTDPVFSGWMVASSPALSALDHARYDVWPLRCVLPDAPAAPEDGEAAPAEGEAANP